MPVAYGVFFRFLAIVGRTIMFFVMMPNEGSS